MKLMKTIALVLVLMLTAGGFALAQTDPAQTDQTKAAQAKAEQDKANQAKSEQSQKAFEEAKQFVYQKNWDAAVSAWEKVMAKSKINNADESLYWLAFSRDKMASSLADMKRQLEQKQVAIESLNSLVTKWPWSPWVKDAKLLRLEIAEALAKNGLNDYRKYINESVAAGVAAGVAGGIEGGVLGGVEANLEMANALQAGILENELRGQRKPMDPDLELAPGQVDGKVLRKGRKTFKRVEIIWKSGTPKD